MTKSPTLAGYFPKQTTVPQGWSTSIATSHVTEICSVSGCIACKPDGWIEHWLHNGWGFYNSRANAARVVPPGSAGFSIFAYRLFSPHFDLGDAAIEPIPPDFISLGFDVVSRSITPFFECSP